MHYLFLLLAIILFTVYLLRSRYFKSALADKRNSFSKGLPEKIRLLYETKILEYSNMEFKKFLKIKTVTLFVSCVFFVAINFTNISVYTNNIFETYDYKTDLIYQEIVKDKNMALQQEIFFLKEAMKTVKQDDLESKEDAQFNIRKLVEKSGIPLAQSADTIANKVYYRLRDYYAVREVNIASILFMSLTISFVPEIFMLARKTFARAEAKKELNLLKQIMIVFGSIKPVDFMQLLNTMIDKSNHHRKILLKIKNANNLNSIDNKELYKDLISNEKDLSIKLFYEKLDQVNNYDFDQAILNIKNEFYFERREVIRNVKKRIEAIHIWGILGFAIIIVFYMAYLIIPWLQAFDMNKII